MNVRKRQRIKSLIKALSSFSNPKKWGVIAETFERTSFDHAFTVSYSQAAEDIALVQILGSEPGFYIDVGAHHPSRFSVTRLLYQRGWNGINIDANPDVKKLFEIDRPKDRFICAAVGNSSSYKFTRFQEPAISTANAKWRDRFEKEGNVIRDEINVIGIKLRDVILKLPEDQKINLLNIDIEGSDLEALNSLELPSVRSNKIPKFISLETSWPVSQALETESVKLAMAWGYQPALVLPMATVLYWP